jgi:adenylate cyclase
VKRPLLRGALAGIVCATLVAAVVVINPTLFGTEWNLRDAFTRVIAKRRPPDPRIVLVKLDDESIRDLEQLNYGRPPYSRDVYALVLRELHRSGARVAAIDILFSEEDVNHPDADRAFAEELGRVPAILGAQVGQGGDVPPAFDSKLWSINGGSHAKVLVSRYAEAEPGLIELAKGTATVHEYPIAHSVRTGKWLPSLALEAVREYRGLPRIATRTGSTFAFGKLRIPVHDDAMTIRWNTLNYREYKLAALVAAALMHDDPSAPIPPSMQAMENDLRGKIVIIGYVAAGLMDLRPNPLDPQSPGMNLHANAIDNLLNASFAREAPLPIELPILILAAALLGAALNPIRSQFVSVLVAIIAVAAALAIAFGAQAGGILLHGVGASSALALTYVTITVAKLLREQEQTAMLTRTFGRYVSPQILDHILAHPERVHLGGERRDLTILFSDIRGFTSISEAAEPEEVVEMLNEYLTRMVEILLAHGGTLDKFIGDAVMGFWNAPAADPEHARHAVACAVAMIEETARIRERWIPEGKAAIRIGVGINSGEAVVGNIGAEQVFGYTVIGDAVNLASRLESKNKDYATEIIISEFTKERIGDEFPLVYLDEVKVKGKENAVKIFQVKA